MRRATFFVTFLVALGLAVLASSAATSRAQSTNIDVGNFYFCSASSENGVCETAVTAGSPVTWQVSAGSHTVTQCDASFATCPPSGGFDSGLLSSGGTFSQTFNSPSSISYWCAFHPTQMRGRILVQAQPTASPAPTATTTPGSATPAPATGATGTPKATSGPAQVPGSGGPPGDTTARTAIVLVAGLLILGTAAAAGTLAAVRARSDGRDG